MIVLHSTVSLNLGLKQRFSGPSGIFDSFVLLIMFDVSDLKMSDQIK